MESGMHTYNGNKNTRYANMQNGGHTFVRRYGPRSFRRLSCIFYAFPCIYIHIYVCVEYVYTHYRLRGRYGFYERRCDVFQRADARMRLIQYISGEMRAEGATTRVEKEEEQGRGGRWRAREVIQSSILLTESPALSRVRRWLYLVIISLAYWQTVVRKARERERKRDTERESSPNTSLPPGGSRRKFPLISTVHNRWCLPPTSLSLLLSLSLAIPFGYPAAIIPAGSRGWSCLRLRLVHRCTHSPPTDGPQCTANSHKAPTDTQMDKRIWTYIYTCTRAEHGSARTFSPVTPIALDARNAMLPYSFAPPLWTMLSRVITDIVVNRNTRVCKYINIYVNIYFLQYTIVYYYVI